MYTAILPTNSPRLALRPMSSTSSFASAQSTMSNTASINAMLAPQQPFTWDLKALSAPLVSRPHTRAASISSACMGSICSYSKDELDREREMFGESAMGVFEPRDKTLGFWGVSEVLSMENL